MKKIDWKILILTMIVSLLPIGIGLAFYDDLPDNIAVHFDINNTPDNYFSKAGFVFGMPVLMAFIQLFCCVINDVSNQNKEANKKATVTFKWNI